MGFFVNIVQKYTIFLFLLISGSVSTIFPSQDPILQKEKSNSDEIIELKTNKNDIPYMYRDALNDSQYSSYTMRSFVFTQDAVIKAAKAAIESNKSINIAVGAHNHNKITALPKNTQINPNEHRKSMVAFAESPSKKQNQNSANPCLIINGSANVSNNAWPARNDEAILVIKNNEELALQMRNAMLSNSPIKKIKEIVQTTPQKTKAYNSKTSDLNALNAHRILNVAQSTNEDRFAFTRTMNINDKEIAKSLRKSAQSGADTRLIVHKSALTKKGISLLQKMKQDGVKVMVFYPSSEKSVIMHVKDIITNTSYTNSTANFTKEGNEQDNITLIVPHNNEIITQAKNHFQEVENKCISLKNALKLYEAHKKEKKKKQEKKRKASTDLKHSPKKRQKTDTLSLEKK